MSRWKEGLQGLHMLHQSNAFLREVECIALLKFLQGISEVPQFVVILPVAQGLVANTMSLGCYGVHSTSPK
jgi:hypothetical protein